MSEIMPSSHLPFNWSEKGKRGERGLIYGHKEHEERHTSSTSIHHEIIDEEGPRRKNRRSRLDKDVLKEAKRVHKCSECSRTFSSGQILGGHMRAHMKRDPKAKNSKKKIIKLQDLESGFEIDKKPARAEENEANVCFGEGLLTSPSCCSFLGEMRPSDLPISDE